MNEQLELISVARVVESDDALTIPSSYWRISLGPAYRGASQTTLDALLTECRAAEVGA